MLCRSKWSVGVSQIAAGLRSESGHPHLLGYYRILDIGFSLFLCVVWVLEGLDCEY